jgi:hypothetical protein
VVTSSNPSAVCSATATGPAEVTTTTWAPRRPWLRVSARHPAPGRRTGSSPRSSRRRIPFVPTSWTRGGTVSRWPGAARGSFGLLDGRRRSPTRGRPRQIRNVAAHHFVDAVFVQPLQHDRRGPSQACAGVSGAGDGRRIDLSLLRPR